MDVAHFHDDNDWFEVPSCVSFTIAIVVTLGNSQTESQQRLGIVNNDKPESDELQNTCVFWNGNYWFNGKLLKTGTLILTLSAS